MNESDPQALQLCFKKKQIVGQGPCTGTGTPLTGWSWWTQFISESTNSRKKTAVPTAHLSSTELRNQACWTRNETLSCSAAEILYQAKIWQEFENISQCWQKRQHNDKHASDKWTSFKFVSQSDKTLFNQDTVPLRVVISMCKLRDGISHLEVLCL